VFRPVVYATESATPSTLAAADVTTLLRAAVCWYDDPALARTCLPPRDDVLAALAQMRVSHDPRFIAPLVDMLWLDIGWERPVRDALEALSPERFATAGEWYAWMQASPPALPDGYAAWKGRLLSIVSPEMPAVIREGSATTVGPEQLVWGLVAPDAQPALTNPKTAPGADTRYLAASDIVYGVAIGGETRAYPERTLGWHGIVEDTVGGRRILVVHCTPCGGAAAFDAEASDGERYSLGASGLVLHSRRLLADAETHSLWDPVSGRAVGGPLAGATVSMKPLNLVRTTWATWGARYGNTRVLTLETGFARDYGEGVALKVDADPAAPLYPVANLDERLPPKTRVLGVTAGGAHRGYLLEAVERVGVVRDTIGNQRVVLLSAGPGRGATAYDATDVTIERLDGSGVDRDAIDSTGQRWFVTDERLQNARNARTKAALPAQVHYWFAWSGAYPDTTLWKP